MKLTVAIITVVLHVGLSTVTELKQGENTKKAARPKLTVATNGSYAPREAGPSLPYSNAHKAAKRRTTTVAKENADSELLNKSEDHKTPDTVVLRPLLRRSSSMIEDRRRRLLEAAGRAQATPPQASLPPTRLPMSRQQTASKLRNL